MENIEIAPGNENAFWFKHSLMFDEDPNLKLLKSGYWDSKNKYIGYYYFCAYCKLLYTYYRKKGLPVKNHEINSLQIMALLNFENLAEVDSFLKILIECSLILPNGLFVNRSDRFFGKESIGNLGQNKKWLFYEAEGILVTKNQHKVVVPTISGRKKLSFKDIIDCDGADFTRARDFASKQIAQSHYELFKGDNQ